MMHGLANFNSKSYFVFEFIVANHSWYSVNTLQLQVRYHYCRNVTSGTPCNLFSSVANKFWKLIGGVMMISRDLLTTDTFNVDCVVQFLPSLYYTASIYHNVRKF